MNSYVNPLVRRLSPREVEVLAAVAVGLTAPQIAQLLGLGMDTVEDYMNRARWKLGSTNRWNTIVVAVLTGQLPVWPEVVLPPIPDDIAVRRAGERRQQWLARRARLDRSAA